MRIEFHEKMKRYALFAGSWYYPSGGMADFVDSYDSLEEAIKEAKRPDEIFPNDAKYDWAHVFDMQEEKVESIEIFA